MASQYYINQYTSAGYEFDPTTGEVKTVPVADISTALGGNTQPITGSWTPDTIKAQNGLSTTPVAITAQDGQQWYSVPKGLDTSKFTDGQVVNLAGTLYSYNANQGKFKPATNVGGDSSKLPDLLGISTAPAAPGVAPGPTTSSGAPVSAPYSTGQAPAGSVNPPPVGQIGNPVQAPTSSTSPAPSLPTPSAGGTQDAYFTSLTQQASDAQAAYEAEAAKRAQDYQTQIDAEKKRLDELNTLEQNGMAGDLAATTEATKQKMDALALEKQRFDDNYNASQALIGEMNDLLTQGNTIIKQAYDTTGLASIRTPQINQTVSDIAARVGVIQAVLSARSGQMSQAQNQLQSTVAAVTSILNDQTDYYKTLLTYYDSLKGETTAQMNKDKADQKAYLDAKLVDLANKMDQVNATSAAIQKAMIDPETALTYAQAGVSLNDSPAQIQQKLAQHAYTKEVQDISNQMSLNGYSQTPIAGVQPVIITDSQGTQRAWYKKDAAGGFNLSAGQTRFDANGNVIASVPDNQTTAPKILGSASTGYYQLNPDGTTTAIKDPNATGGGAGGTTNVTNPDIQKLLTDTTIAQSGNYARISGGQIVDLTTGKVVNDGTGNASSSGSPAPGTKGTKTSGTFTYAPSDVQQVKDFMLSTAITDKNGNPNRGSDGYVNPQVYLDALSAWVASGGLQADFLKEFPIKSYVNPANTWPQIVALGGGTPPKTTKTSSSSSSSLDSQINGLF